MEEIQESRTHTKLLTHFDPIDKSEFLLSIEHGRIKDYWYKTRNLNETLEQRNVKICNIVTNWINTEEVVGSKLLDKLVSIFITPIIIEK